MPDDSLPSQIGEMTLLLQQLDAPEVEEEVLRRSFVRLRRIAANVVRQYGRGLSVAPSDVVQEYYLRLRSHAHEDFRSTEDFLRWSWMKMKNVVWDYARKRKAAVRGGGAHRVDIDEVLADLRHNGLGTVDVAPDELLFLEQLLSKLQARNQRDSDFVDLYYFAGLSQAEIAARFGLTEEAVKDRLKVIRLWLRKEILRAHNVDRLTSS